MQNEIKENKIVQNGTDQNRMEWNGIKYKEM